jgi:hypothetical protein
MRRISGGSMIIDFLPAHMSVQQCGTCIEGAVKEHAQLWPEAACTSGTALPWSFAPKLGDLCSPL